MQNLPFNEPAADLLSDERLGKELNDKQLEAVNISDGPLLILAGAGSGKTRVITYRIARLVERGVYPDQIMALTFTNKAAAEMKHRTMALLNRGRFDIWISTFHSACLRILRRHADRINYPKDFAVYDAQDQTRLIKNCLKEIGVDEKLYPARKAGALISRFKNRLEGPEEAEKSYGRRDAEFSKLFYLYERKLMESKCMDFDDLLGKSVRLLQQDDELRGRFQDRFEHLLVDEFQDTNLAQYRLIRLLSGEKRNICVVGDDDQSIYQWRGADIGNILNFEKDYPEAKIVMLEQNYRSTSNILRAASAVVERNHSRKDKKLWTENEAGNAVTLFTAYNDIEEAEFVVQCIQKLVKRENVNLKDIAIFYRTNSQSRVLEDILRREGFPYQIFGGLKFYDRKEVKDILAYFRTALNPFDSVSLKRIINSPPRGIGATTVGKLELSAIANGSTPGAMLDDIGSIEGLNSGAAAKLEAFREILSTIRTYASTLDPGEALAQSLPATGYVKWLEEDKQSESFSRLENLNELINAATDFTERTRSDSMVEFLDQAALVSDADKVEEGEGTIKMMTVHISKGLEFPVVFVTGLEENIFPHALSKDDPAQMQEERRLLYVAMTRAQERLYLSHAMNRRLMGVSKANMPSRFLDDLPVDLLKAEKGTGRASPVWDNTRYPMKRSKPVAAYDSSPTRQSPFGKEEERSIDGLKVGVKVTHPQFSNGEIKKIEGKGDKAKITIYFPKYGARKLMKKFANLTIVG